MLSRSARIRSPHIFTATPPVDMIILHYMGKFNPKSPYALELRPSLACKRYKLSCNSFRRCATIIVFLGLTIRNMCLELRKKTTVFLKPLLIFPMSLLLPCRYINNPIFTIFYPVLLTGNLCIRGTLTIPIT